MAGKATRAVVVVVAAAGLLTGAGRHAPTTGQQASGVHMTARTQATVTPDDVYKLCAQTLNGPVPDTEANSSDLAGWGSTAKLGGSLEIGYPVPAAAGSPTGGYKSATALASDGNYYNCQKAQLNLANGEFPPATATFTSFGFVPVTATVHVAQAGQQPITAVIFNRTANTSTDAVGTQAGTIVASADLTLRVGDVKVNGTPLNVGGDCRTDGILTTPGSPFYDPAHPSLILAGGADQPGLPTPQYDFITYGGGVAGTATIPPFTGCGPNGDLDPLLDAAVSGRGNVIKTAIGPLCTSVSAWFDCVPGTLNNPTPTALYPPYWNVPHGGAFTATAVAATPLTIGQVGLKVGRKLRAGATVVCTDSKLAGTIFASEGAPRGDLGTLQWTSFGGTCTGSDRLGSDDSTWTITEQGTAGVSATSPQIGNPPGRTLPAGSSQLRIDQITLVLHELTGTDGDCEVTLTGSEGAYYTNGPHPELSMQVGGSDGALEVASSGCPDEFGSNGTTTPSSEASGNVALTAGYELSSPISITGFSPAP